MKGCVVLLTPEENRKMDADVVSRYDVEIVRREDILWGNGKELRELLVFCVRFTWIRDEAERRIETSVKLRVHSQLSQFAFRLKGPENGFHCLFFFTPATANLTFVLFHSTENNPVEL